MEQLFQQVQEVFVNLFNSDNLRQALSNHQVAAFVALNLIVFVETGLFAFFLPGDSLLVTAGLVAYVTDPPWPLHWLILTLCASAIIGDSVSYAIGRKIGPRLFNRPNSWLFRKDYLDAARAFYDKHGGKTIILARFVPIIRTFAPVVAGAAKMDYRKFVTYNVVGGIGWVVSMILIGYALTPVLEPALQQVFGADFKVIKHVEKVILLVVFLSVVPILYAGGKNWLAKRRAARLGAPTPVVVSAAGETKA